MDDGRATTDSVVESFSETPDERLRAVLTSLTEHLHAFVRDVRPSLPEWEAAIGFLTEVGHWSDDRRQEFVLLSDVLGVSMLVENLNDRPGGTEGTVLGPFHVVESPRRELGDSIDLLGGRAPAVVTGRVVTTAGEGVPGAEVDVWQCTEDGYYDVQQPDVQPPGNGRGLFRADDDGRFWFRTVVPSHYPIPTDGPVGALLGAAGRHPYRPAHVHVICSAPGYAQVTTHLFVAGSRYLDSDAVFAVRPGLVVDFAASSDAADAARLGVPVPFYRADVEISLVPA